MEPSWRTKLTRAEDHLREFDGRIAAFKERRGYPVSEGFETENEERLSVSRIEIPEPDDPLLPIIAGELLFNLRSALDHLATALVPETERTRKTAFPIFTDDIDEIDPATGKHLHRKARGRWEAMTKGFPEDAMSIVELVQPYHFRRQGLDPQYASLALLSALQNADKHSRLVVVVAGLRDPTVWFNVSEFRKIRARFPRLPDDHVLSPRAVVRREVKPLPSDVEMETEGTLDVMIGDGRSGAYHSCPEIFDSMIRDTTGVLDQLEGHAVHLPPPPARYVIEP